MERIFAIIVQYVRTVVKIKIELDGFKYIMLKFVILIWMKLNLTEIFVKIESSSMLRVSSNNDHEKIFIYEAIAIATRWAYNNRDFQFIETKREGAWLQYLNFIKIIAKNSNNANLLNIFHSFKKFFLIKNISWSFISNSFHKYIR